MLIKATPHGIAAGVAAGVFASFTPFIGFHFLLGCAVAVVLRGNLLAAVLGTAVGNPLTFPLIWSVTYAVGRSVLGFVAPDLVAHTAAGGDVLSQSLDAIGPLIVPMVIGGIPIGLVAGGISYAVVWYLVRGYQTRRRHAHLQAKAAAAARAVEAARAFEGT